MKMGRTIYTAVDNILNVVHEEPLLIGHIFLVVCTMLLFRFKLTCNIVPLIHRRIFFTAFNVFTVQNFITVMVIYEQSCSHRLKCG
jgi:hypothetical protein